MRGSPQIAFLDMRDSIAVRDAVAASVRELARISERLERCRVLIAAPHRHDRPTETLYGVRIRLSFSDDDLAVEVQPRKESVYEAIQYGFEIAQRKLEGYERRRRQDADRPAEGWRTTGRPSG